MRATRKQGRSTILVLISVALVLAWFFTPIVAKAEGKLLDPAFAQQLCQAWNSSSLPDKLSRAGSGWIDSADSKGRQVIVVTRRDCHGWHKVQLVIEADAAGRAVCAAGGVWNGSDPYTWKFEPTTEQWADFADGFGMLDMPKIMPGFVGPYAVAMKNMGNFGTFFAMVGQLALTRQVDWICQGADAEEVAEEVADIDRAKMKKIARG